MRKYRLSKLSWTTYWDEYKIQKRVGLFSWKSIGKSFYALDLGLKELERLNKKYFICKVCRRRRINRNGAAIFCGHRCQNIYNRWHKIFNYSPFTSSTSGSEVNAVRGSS